MSLSTSITELKASANAVTYAEILTYLSEDNVRLIDQFRSGSPSATEFVKSRILQLAALCQELEATLNAGRMVELNNLFSETLMFVKLAGQFLAERVPEIPQDQTPDFQIKFDNLDLFVEGKALNVADGKAKHRKIMEEGLDTKIEMEEKSRDGASVATGIQVIQSHQKRSKPYDSQSLKLVTENLIEKIAQNISAGQFSKEPTILLVDLCDQLLIHGSASENIDREFGSPPQSGELWHAAFGEIGAPMKRALEFEIPQSELAKIKHETLDREGILRRYSFVRGIAFHYGGRFWGAAFRYRHNVKVIDFLKEFCERVAIEPM
jgi:hypothetical protein